jgi:hypothetical protein
VYAWSDFSYVACCFSVCVLALSFKGCEFLEVLSKILATMHLGYVSRVVYIFVIVDVRRVMLGLSNLE